MVICQIQDYLITSKISAELKFLIKEFFENDEISNISWKKDYIKIGDFYHQRRILIDNFSNVYNLFINDYKEKMNSICLDQNGLYQLHLIHIVCICAIHQNVKTYDEFIAYQN